MYDSKDDTMRHIRMVRMYLNKLISSLEKKADCHDSSKLEAPEKEIFDIFTPKLKNSTYGSDEYKSFLSDMSIATEHHYKHNRHHPEHHKEGIQGMDLMDLAEMIADWKAATLRHANGNIYGSIEINQKRFDYSDELKQILINTVDNYFQ